MAKQNLFQEIKEETALLKTNTSIERLTDGSCIKRITQTKDGKTEVSEEKVDCDQALKEVREKDDSSFSQGTDSFDERMRDKLNEMKKSFSKEENKANMRTSEETSSDGTNRIVKVSRESDTIEETKKTEKIPDGSKRILKISREHFFEETKKSVGPMETEEELEGVKLLDESFAEESKDKTTHGEPDCGEETKDDSKKDKKEEKEDDGKDKEEDDDSDDEVEVNELDEEKDSKQRYSEENMRIVEEEEDGFIKKIAKNIFKFLFWPLFKLKIL